MTDNKYKNKVAVAINQIRNAYGTVRNDWELIANERERIENDPNTSDSYKRERIAILVSEWDDNANSFRFNIEPKLEDAYNDISEAVEQVNRGFDLDSTKVFGVIELIKSGCVTDAVADAICDSDWSVAECELIAKAAEEHGNTKLAIPMRDRTKADSVSFNFSSLDKLHYAYTYGFPHGMFPSEIAYATEELIAQAERIAKAL